MTTDIVQQDATSEDSVSTDTPSLEQMVDQGSETDSTTVDTPNEANLDSSLTDDTESNPETSQAEVDAEAAFDAAAAEPDVPTPEQKPAAPELPPELQQILADPRGRDQLLNLHKLYGQQSNEVGKLRQQMQAYQELGDPQQLRSVLEQQQEQARMSNLNPWNRGHPQHQRFQTTRDRWRIDQKRIERVPPENREAVRQALEGDYSPEDLQALKSYEDWRSSEESLSPEDREDRQREIARQETLSTIQQWEQSQMHRMQARAVLEKNGDALAENFEDVERFMNPATPRRDLAVDYVRIKAELEALKGKSIKDTRQVATAQARDRMVKQQAGISRDGAPRRIDMKTEALRRAKLGEDPFDVMMELSEQSQNPHSSQ